MGDMCDTAPAPGKSLTRAEAVQALYNLEGQPAVTATTAFADSAAHWAKTPMAWANGNVLVNGFEDDTIRPQGATTRTQAASILMGFDQNLAE